MRLALPIAVVLLSALAGCSGGGGGGDDDEGEVPTLKATDTTGVIRALAVDEAIRPLPGVLVAIQGGVNKTTDQDGFAGFEDLQPGTYIVEARLAGHLPVTQSVDVVAGVDDPPVTKFQLAAVAGAQPFYEQRVYEGFLQCAAGGGGSSANVCFIANYYPCLAMSTAGQACSNTTADNSYFSVPFFLENARVPDWTQVEMVWDSTQTVSRELMMRVNIVTDSIDYARSARGASPLNVSINQTQAAEWGLGVNRSMSLEAFTSSTIGTSPVGLAVNQQIRYYVFAFYGYTPPEGWRFADGTPIPPPPY